MIVAWIRVVAAVQTQRKIEILGIFKRQSQKDMLIDHMSSGQVENRATTNQEEGDWGGDSMLGRIPI